jgi:ribosome maturation factor RimP
VKVKKIIVNLFVFISLGLVSLYGYLYFSIKGDIDSNIEMLEPHVSITYDAFKLPLDGTIAIEGVLISSNFGVGSEIDSVELKVDSILDYLDVSKTIDNNEIVKKMQLKVNHAHIDLSFIMEALKQNKSTFDRILQRVAAQGCGDIKSINYKYLPEFGYTEFDGSLNLDFEYSDYSSVADVTFDISWHDMTSYSFKTSIPNMKTYYDFYNPENEVIDFELGIQDLGYNERFIKFCSKESGVSLKDYVDYHIDELRKYLSSANVSFSDDIYAAYKSYLSKQSTITFKIKPNSAVSYKYIDLYKPKDWPQVLGLDILVDGKKTNDLSMNWDRTTVANDLLNSKSKKDKEIKKEVSSRRIKFSDFKYNLNSYVEIKTRSGRQYKGNVLEVYRNKVILETEVENKKGKVTVHKDSISSIYLFK